MENPIKMDDLGVPLFLETPILILGQMEDTSAVWSLPTLPMTAVDIAKDLSRSQPKTSEAKSKAKEKPKQERMQQKKTPLKQIKAVEVPILRGLWFQMGLHIYIYTYLQPLCIYYIIYI